MNAEKAKTSTQMTQIQQIGTDFKKDF